jgi:uncharacterized protein
VFTACLLFLLLNSVFDARQRNPKSTINRTMNQLIKCLFTALAAFATLPGLCQASSIVLPVKELVVGTHKVRAEIAATPSDRQQGLMFRASMPAQHGMLFVFDETAGHCFWMRNTPLPLTIGFIDEAGVLINTADMAPFNDASHCPTKPAKYALEMNQGWFVKHHVKAGAKVTGLPKP